MATYQASQLQKKADFTAFAKEVEASITFNIDDVGITGTEIKRLFLVGVAAHYVLFEQINKLPLVNALERLTIAYRSLLDDDLKKSFAKKVHNLTSPSQKDIRRGFMTAHAGKVGFDKRKGAYIDISAIDNSHKAKKPEKPEKKIPIETKLSTIDPEAPKVDAPPSQLSTVVRSEPLPTGNDAQDRLVASLVVSALNGLDTRHLVSLVGELNKAIDERALIPSKLDLVA